MTWFIGRLAFILMLCLPSAAYSSVVYKSTSPPDAFNRTAELTNPNNLSIVDKDKWYIADHPFFYLMEKVRAPNGSWIPNPNASMPPFTVEEWRKNTMERVPWWIRWYVTGETRELRKEMVKKRALIIDHVVSPMDYGRSLRAQSVRAQWHEQVRHFWMGAIGKKAIQNVMHNFQKLLFGGLQDYIDMKLWGKKFAPMNSTEWGLYNNMTMAEIDQVHAEAAERVRWKWTRSYHYKLPSDMAETLLKAAPHAQLMVQYFQPYPNYTSRYYDAGEELPPPTMPAAISYPWPWTGRIAQLRAALVEVMRVEAVKNSMIDDNQRADASGNGSSLNETMPTETIHRALQVAMNNLSSFDDEAGVDPYEGSGITDAGNVTQFGEDNKTAVIQQLELLAKEFHFTTGLPRFNMMKDRYSVVVFPTLHQFLNLSIDANGSVSVVPGDQFTSEPEAGAPSRSHGTNLSDLDQELPDYTSREGVYTAVRYFYSFATVESGYVRKKDYYTPETKPPLVPTDGTVLVQDLTPKEKVEFVYCSVESPCLVRSGVTVYTPRVSSAVLDLFVNMSSTTTAAADAQRQKRQDWIMHIVQEAFDAERRVIHSGLVAPSTVWNSFYDRSTDILADAVFGFVNGSKATSMASGTGWTGRSIFERLMDNTSSPLMHGFSYFRMMAWHTRNAMFVDKTVPALVPFTSAQLIHLVGFLMGLMRELQIGINQYESKRDADLMHVSIVNATNDQAYYDGRLFGVLGYGYFLPATNKDNVAYRDHKIPVPFHLVMRILTRLHESNLLLPEESVHLAACVAMLQFDVRYYRCTELKEEGKATPRPMQTNPESLPPPTASTPVTLSVTISPSITPRPAPHNALLDWS